MHRYPYCYASVDLLQLMKQLRMEHRWFVSCNIEIKNKLRNNYCEIIISMFIPGGVSVFHFFTADALVLFLCVQWMHLHWFSGVRS